MVDALLSVRDLTKYFPVIKGVIRSRQVGEIKAVDGVSFDVRLGETLGLVGESGCGKTTTGRLILRLLEPSAGQVSYRGVELTSLRPRQMDGYRRKLQIIFQDPYASLNPRITVGDAIGEPLIAHGLADRKTARERVLHLLNVVGLAPFHYNRYPHEFSGGQRQRVGIARALVLEPEFIVADEPVSALDVSIQAQIINLLERIQAEFGLTFLFISHDLGVIRHISNRVLVMYLGQIVEMAEAEALFTRPLHPYTQALLSAIPSAKPGMTKERILLTGDVPSPLNPPGGCRFHTRCPSAMPRCKAEEPVWKEVGSGHYTACHLY
ncbi:MAG TPA: dipeptide ABC transporter ATP-binding protein [Gammaproteobacteria bacterium]|jgi:oligopeptide/dipeptide ABC transporter ATP-binding protein|nr:dipeptide ABC transporter ATP-binding protein [Gammaproteobacteria bacterium]